MAEFAPFLLAMSIVLFVHMLPTFAAVTLPVWLGFRLFGRDGQVYRRALAGWLVCGAIGYITLFGYYAVSGSPPQASSIFNHSFHGAFFGAGYGGLAALFYFHLRRGNRAGVATRLR